MLTGANPNPNLTLIGANVHLATRNPRTPSSQRNLLEDELGQKDGHELVYAKAALRRVHGKGQDRTG